MTKGENNSVVTEVKERNKKPAWISIVTQYHRPDPIKSAWQIVTTFVPYFALWYLMYRSLAVSYWLTLLLAVPAALLVVRVFVIQHDCGHGSFFPVTTS